MINLNLWKNRANIRHLMVRIIILSNAKFQIVLNPWEKLPPVLRKQDTQRGLKCCVIAVLCPLHQQVCSADSWVTKTVKDFWKSPVLLCWANVSLLMCTWQLLCKINGGITVSACSSYAFDVPQSLAFSLSAKNLLFFFQGRTVLSFTL